MGHGYLPPHQENRKKAATPLLRCALGLPPQGLPCVSWGGPSPPQPLPTVTATRGDRGPSNRMVRTDPLLAESGFCPSPSPWIVGCLHPGGLYYAQTPLRARAFCFWQFCCSSVFHVQEPASEDRALPLAQDKQPQRRYQATLWNCTALQTGQASLCDEQCPPEKTPVCGEEGEARDTDNWLETIVEGHLSEFSFWIFV